MTRIVCISDTHTQQSKLKMPRGDILLHAGDWTHRGEQHHTITFLKWMERQDYAHKVFIAGNHDFYPQRNYADFLRLVKIHAPSCTYLQDESVTIEGFKIHGSPVSPVFGDWAFNRNQTEIMKHWAMIRDDTDILVVHTPALNYGDKLGANGSQPYQNIGCPSLLSEVNTRLKNLKLLVCGHIHEGYGMYQNEKVTIVNASVLNEMYNLVNAPVLLEL